MKPLKPCPFCGSERLVVHEGKYAWVNCLNCETDGPVKQLGEEAIEAWNRRAEGEAR